VSDASGGYELSLDYGYPWRRGRTVWVPSVGARWLSRDLTRYYYGTWDTEAARGVPGYRPDAALVPQLKLSVLHPLGERWRLFGAVSYRLLPDAISDSPFLEPDRHGSGNVQVGVSRGF
ncbi:MipA/OmpV family protein, partial [Xanthomonas sp. Kuri4-3]